MDESHKIIFLGSPEFGAIILEKLIKRGYKPFLVITETDKPAGRKKIITPSPVKVLAQKYNIPVAQPEKIGSWEGEIKNLKPVLMIIAAYGQILPKNILEIPAYGCLNVHPSLLPKYRGPSPIQYAILNGDEKTGVTIMRISEKLDSGSVISQKEVLIEKNETSQVLHDKLAQEGAELLIQSLQRLFAGKITSEKQNDSMATYTKILKKEDGKINWEKSAEEIEREIRAFEMWPGSFTFWKKDSTILRLKIKKARVLKHREHFDNYPIGKTLIAPQNELCVQCGKDFLMIEKLQLEGKKEMNSEEFLRGQPNFIGTILS